jgi:hypothetical protein
MVQSASGRGDVPHLGMQDVLTHPSGVIGEEEDDIVPASCQMRESLIIVTQGAHAMPTICGRVGDVVTAADMKRCWGLCSPEFMQDLFCPIAENEAIRGQHGSIVLAQAGEVEWTLPVA